MAINATNNGSQRELIAAGNYVARCYQMIHIGTVIEQVLGQAKTLNKVRIGWELPMELKVFKEENGEQPCVISKEYTLSMNEKANLRKILASWRGKDFTDEEAKCFDITKLLGAACMINIIHKPNKEGTKMYEEIAGITPLPKGFVCPSQINNNMVWDYDNPDLHLLANLPDFIKDKIKTSEEYCRLIQPNHTNADSQPIYNPSPESVDDLPF
jgi:hypothetical protein